MQCMCDLIIYRVYRKTFPELEKCYMNLQACRKQSYVVGERKLLFQFFHIYAKLLGTSMRRHAIRSISRPLQDELKKRLLQERDSIVDSDISYKILGEDLVIPTKCIEV